MKCEISAYVYTRKAINFYLIVSAIKTYRIIIGRNIVTLEKCFINNLY